MATSSRLDPLISRIIDGYKISSRRSYELAWRSLSDFVGSSKISSEILYDWVKHLRTRPGIRHPDIPAYATATVNKYVGSMTGVFEQLFQDGHITRNPFRDRSIKRVSRDGEQKRPTRIPTHDQIRRMMDKPSPLTLRGLRDRALLVVLFGAGLRRSEIVGMTVADCYREKLPLDSGHHVTFISLMARRTKNGKPRTITLAPWAAERVCEYLDARRPLRPLDALFLDLQGESIKDHQIYQIARYWGRKVGIHFHPHCARAALATRMLAAGEQHRAVQDILGHSTPAMTERYNKLRPNRLDQATVRLTY